MRGWGGEKEQEEEKEGKGGVFWTGEERQRRVKGGNRQEKSVRAVITRW